MAAHWKYKKYSTRNVFIGVRDGTRNLNTFQQNRCMQVEEKKGTPHFA